MAQNSSNNINEDSAGQADGPPEVHPPLDSSGERQRLERLQDFQMQGGRRKQWQNRGAGPGGTEGMPPDIGPGGQRQRFMQRMKERYQQNQLGQGGPADFGDPGAMRGEPERFRSRGVPGNMGEFGGPDGPGQFGGPGSLGEFGNPTDFGGPGAMRGRGAMGDRGMEGGPMGARRPRGMGRSEQAAMGMPHSEGMGGFGNRSRNRQLDLTPLGLNQDQKARIAKLREQTKVKSREMRKSLMTKQLEMRKLIFDPTATEAQIRASRKSMRTAQDQLDEINLNDILSIRAMLTPDQKKKLPQCMPGTAGANDGESVAARGSKSRLLGTDVEFRRQPQKTK